MERESSPLPTSHKRFSPGLAATALPYLAAILLVAISPIDRSEALWSALGVTSFERSGWLGGVLLKIAFRTAGQAGLRWLELALILVPLHALAVFLWRRTADLGYTGLILALGLLVERRGLILGPSLLGHAIFCALALLVVPEPRRLDRWQWLTSTLLCALWVNIDADATNALAIPLFLLPGAFLFAKGERRGAALFLLPLSGLFLQPHPFQALSALPCELSAKVGWPPAWIELSRDRLSVTAGLESALFFTIAAAGIWLHARARDEGCSYRSACIALWLLLASLSREFFPFLILPLAQAAGAATVIRATKRFPRLRAARGLVFLGTTLATLTAGNAFHSPPALAEPMRATRFLSEVPITGRLWTVDAWRSFLALRLPAGTSLATDVAHSDIWVRSSHRPRDPSRVDGWTLAFENNLAQILVKGTKLTEIARYYRVKGVPFEPSAGFQIERAFAAAPRWTASLQEPSEHRWADPAQRTARDLDDALFYASRGLGEVALQMTRKLLQQGRAPAQARVLRAELLLARGELAQARALLSRIDPEGAPTRRRLSELRFHLWRDEEARAGRSVWQRSPFYWNHLE